jgi:hypothetical protein
MSERIMTPEMRLALTADVVWPIIFVYASFPDIEVRLWSGNGIFSWGGETWFGVGALIAVEDISESIDSGQRGVAVKFSGIPSEFFIAAGLGNYQNRPAKIWLGALRPKFELAMDPQLLFSGFMDSDHVMDNGSTVIITIFAESRLNDQLRARVFRYSHEDQQMLYPEADDKGLEFVAALQDVALKWGTK